MALATVAGRPKRQRSGPIGSIKLSRGRAEGASFNDIPRIMAAFPQEISEIVKETTVELAAFAEANAPEQPHRGRPYGSWNGRPDVAPGTLKRSVRVRFAKRRGTDITISGRVDFKAVDPTRKEPNHSFAKAVEVGSVRTNRSIGKGAGHYRIPADPFLVPALVAERPLFIERIARLESRLPRR